MTYGRHCWETRLSDFLKTDQCALTVAAANIVTGDHIRWVEVVWPKPPRRKAKAPQKVRPAGERLIEAEVIDQRRDDQGRPWLLLRVLHAMGYDRVQAGTPIRRSIRELAKCTVFRRRWADEPSRQQAVYHWQNASATSSEETQQ